MTIHVPPATGPYFARAERDLLARFELESELGRGPLGVVYKASNRFEQNTPPRAIKFCLNPAMLKTGFGGTRIIDLLVGDPLPRIC